MANSRSLRSVRHVQLIDTAEVKFPDSYSLFLLDVITPFVSGTCLDLCCGSGFLGISLAKAGAKVTVTDISPQAIEVAKLNAQQNSVSLEARQGNLFESTGGKSFKNIVAVPPIMPTPPHAEPEVGGPRIAEDGGIMGRDVYDTILASAAKYLSADGSLWMLHPWYFDFETTLAAAKAGGLDSERIASDFFPIGRLSGIRLPYLNSLGFRPFVSDEGRLLQEMLVLRFSQVAR